MKTLFQSIDNDDLRQSVEALIGKPVELTVFHGGSLPETEVALGTLTSLYHYQGEMRGSDTIVRVAEARVHVGKSEDWTLRLLGAPTPDQIAAVGPGAIHTADLPPARPIQGVAIDAMVHGRYDGRRPAEIVRRVSGDAWIMRYIDGYGTTHEVGRFASEIHADPEILNQMMEMPIER